jgi:hypothetical protein
LYAQPAHLGGAAEADAAPVELYNIADNRQSQAMALYVLIQTAAAPGQVLNIVILQSGAVVLDKDSDLLTSFNTTDYCRYRPFTGVVEQISQQFQHILPITEGFNKFVDPMMNRKGIGICFQ